MNDRNSSDDIATLKQVPLFAGLDDTELAGVRAIMEPKHYVPGQVIIREGEPGDYFHVITDGEVQFSTLDAGGNELILGEAGRVGFFGELSMLTGDVRAVRVRARDRVTTLALDRKQFHQFLTTHPAAGIDVLTTIARRLHATDNLLRQSVSRNVNDVMDEKITVSQKIADGIAEFSGSIAFLVGNAVWFGGWLLWNQSWFPGYDFDPYPFGLLTMIVSLEAIFLSIFVLVSQNRQSAKDRLAAEIDHQVNVKAELKVGLIMNRLDDLERSMHYLHDEQRGLLKQAAGAGANAASAR
jgi:uncharacterized membrane protein